MTVFGRKKTKDYNMKFKRIAFVTDTHCGHQFGLTPTEWQWQPNHKSADSLIRRRNKCAIYQQQSWDWYAKMLKRLQPIDYCICGGDMVDGAGKKSGGSEQISTDGNVQIAMACAAIREVRAKHIVMVYGSCYHVAAGDGGTDYEDIIAHEVGAQKIGSHEWIDVYGNTIDVRHKTGRSSIPHGKGTLLSKEWLWSALWHDTELAPKSNIILRGHVHYPYEVSDPAMGYTAIIGPALQWSSKYGARECLGVVSVGFVTFDIYEDGHYTHEFHIAKLESQKTKAIAW